VKTVILAGGVAANPKLRATMYSKLAHNLPLVRYVEPPLAYCTDNAAMIAMAAYFSAKRGKFDDAKKGEVDPAWELGR
jgi:N6-L-threonylcarbamoyladenine synthase